MENKTKFGRGTSLREAMDELKENGLIEITRIVDRQGFWTFEYNVE